MPWRQIQIDQSDAHVGTAPSVGYFVGGWNPRPIGWNLEIKWKQTQVTTHTKSKMQKLICKNWKLRQKHQIHLCFLRSHICQERGRKERLEIDQPVGSVSIHWFCRTVLTIVKMKELLSNYSSVYKSRDDFFVYKGQSIMGLILEVDRIGLSHGEAVW